MNRRPILWVIGAILAIIVTFSVAYPEPMVSPGPLIAPHAALARNCFACHTAFQGVSPARCTACHTVSDIGRKNTKGIAFPATKQSRAFHTALTKTDCVICHTDHAGPLLTHHARKIFDHTLLVSGKRAQCAACHTAPADALHRQVGSTCASCHAVASWKPATFDHQRYFALEGPHKASCSTCHTGGNFKTYTCYSCHEHKEADIRAEHRNEGIVNISSCARCHRNANEEGGESEAGGGRNHDD